MAIKWNENYMKGTIEKLNGVKEQLVSFKDEIKKEVKEPSEDMFRRKEIVVFRMKDEKDTSDREQVEDTMRTLGYRVDPGVVKVVDVIRMRKVKGNDNIGRPLIVEFKDDYDKWKVI